jgi:mitochondrial distribution and morphology protein 12
MSVDLQWDSLLESSLPSSLVDLLNKQLSSIQRPSFIGPVQVTSLELGSVPPDIELVELRDIYLDFLEDDDDGDELNPVNVTESASDEEGFEWVSRKTAAKAAAEDEGPAYHHLPPHMRYGRGPVQDLFASTPGLSSPRPPWGSPLSASFVDSYFGRPSSSIYRSSFSGSPFTPAFGPQPQGPRASRASSPDSLDSETPARDTQPSAPVPAPSNQPDLQVHLHITWNSNLRITLTTSLLINYPSPMFMSLPIKLSVTGLLFNGELAVAYEGSRKRVHLCILDDMDPYGPAGERPKRSPDDTPPDLDEPSSTKPLPIGQRLLPSIYIESEIGQADMHVLRNVSRVERFIQDVIRKTVEEELVFPNFHTLVMGE